MDDTMEWNVICRICLQEGEMRSIFDKDDDDEDMKVCDKIMECSNIKIHKDENLPENICSKCYENLKTAYAFRRDCENSEAVLQSFIKGECVNELVTSVNNGKHKLIKPKGITIKRFPPISSSSNMDPLKQEQQSNSSLKIHVENYENKNKTAMDYCDYEIEHADVKTEYDDDDNREQSYKDITEYYIELNDANMEEDENCEEFTLQLASKPKIKQKNKKETSDESSVSSLSLKKERKQIDKTKPRKKSTAVKQPKVHICDICGNLYKQKHSLDIHMRRHRNEKPFACEICGRAFVLNVELKCHMRTHTGQKPYGCRFCERHFSDFGSRIKHERMHTGERPYVCDTCGKAFAYSYGLSSHMLTHTGEKPYECSKCSRRFTKKHHLKNHLQTHKKQELKLQLQHGLPLKISKMIEEKSDKNQLLKESMGKVLQSFEIDEDIEEIEDAEEIEDVQHIKEEDDDDYENKEEYLIQNTENSIEKSYVEEIIEEDDAKEIIATYYFPDNTVDLKNQKTHFKSIM